MKVMFFIKSGRRCAASVFVLVGLVTLTGTATMNYAEGTSSAYCQKNTGYNCGAVFPLNGNTCGQSGCCCRRENGTGMKYNTCDSAKGYAYRGCNSCLGTDACFKTNNINAGTSSCHGTKSCREVSDSIIGNDSCQGNYSCLQTSNTNVGTSSCHGKGSCKDVSDSTIGNDSCHGDYSCSKVQNATIHDGSCRCDDGDCCEDVKNAIIGKGSCNGGTDGYSCAGSENVKIGINSCNGGGGVCKNCAHNVPDNVCNQGSTDDMTGGYCNYCVATQGVVPSSTSKNKKSKSNKKQAVGQPKKK